MNISVIPARCIRVADELKQIERQLNIQASEIEAVIASLKITEDEAMMTIAVKLSKTLEDLQTKIRVTKLEATALSKIATVYAKMENGVADYENVDMFRKIIRYKATTLNGNRTRIERTFEKL